jgi:hypothetical protein
MTLTKEKLDDVVGAIKLMLDLHGINNFSIIVNNVAGEDAHVTHLTQTQGISGLVIMLGQLTRVQQNIMAQLNAQSEKVRQ